MYHKDLYTFISNPFVYLIISILLLAYFIRFNHIATSTLQFQLFTQPIVYRSPVTAKPVHLVLFVAPTLTDMFVKLNPLLMLFTNEYFRVLCLVTAVTFQPVQI